MEPFDGALRLTRQIPDSPEYEWERKFCWHTLGLAALRLDRPGVVREAIGALGETWEGADLRVHALDHPALRSEVLAEFTSRIADWEPHGGVGKVVAALAKEAPLSTVTDLIRQLRSPFGRIVQLITVARSQPDRVLARSLVEEAWSQVDEVEVDHQYALNWVVSGFRDLGLFEEALAAANNLHDPAIKLDTLAELTAAMAAANEPELAREVVIERESLRTANPGVQAQSEVLQLAEELVAAPNPFAPDPPPLKPPTISELMDAGKEDEAARLIVAQFPTRVRPAVFSLRAEAFEAMILGQLTAVEAYHRNDLRVEFLADLSVACHTRGRALPQAALERLGTPSWLALQPAPPPTIGSCDPSELTLDAFQHLLFDRPVAETAEEHRIYNRDRPNDLSPTDELAFLRLVTELFEGFGAIARDYTSAQLNQGMWFLSGDPFFLTDHWTRVADDRLPQDALIENVRSTYHLYADYVSVNTLPESVGSFHMLFDCAWEGARPPIRDATLETLIRILQLSDWNSRAAALHGLNHLHPHPGTSEAVEAFIEAHARELSPDELRYAEVCRAGEAM